MITFFWDASGIIYIDYLPTNQKITGDYYAAELDRFNNALKEKRPHLSRNKVLFHQDNACVHTCPAASAKFHEFNYELLPHQPNSPDLAPCDYYLFPNLKKWLAGKKFRSNEDFIAESEVYFKGLDGSYCSAGIEKLEERWTKCIELNGDYIEK